MSGRERSRREFILRSLSGIGAAWAVANYAGIEDASAFAQQSARTGPTGHVRLLHACAGRRGRGDGGADHPDRLHARRARGARRSCSSTGILSTFEKDAQADYTQGLDELAVADPAAVPSRPPRFSALTADQQIKVLTAMEKTPFFNLVRTHTITGFFAAPVHGGNANKVGWKLVNYDDSLNHKPPFGYYDALPGSTSR